MLASGRAYGRAALLACVACGCLAAPPPSELAEPVDAGGLATCTPGDPIAGEPFNASPVDPNGACSVESARERDGKVVGLDRFGDFASSCSMWGDPELAACGCVGLDLGAVYRLSRFTVRAMPVGSGCGNACTECGSGHTFTTWVGAEAGTFQAVSVVEMDDDVLQDYLVNLAPTALRYLVVCRDAWGIERDDVAVDAVEVICE